MLNLFSLTQEVCRIAEKAGNFITEERKLLTAQNIEAKGEHDFVTSVDKASEKLLVNELSQLLPEAGFIAEEGTGTKNQEGYNWIIDPIDGTTNFIHGLPCYSVSIALADEHNQLLIGVVYEIAQKECFYASKGNGAYLNGNRIAVSKETALNQSLLATGFPYNDYSQLNEYLEVFKLLLKESRGLRRLGSAAVDLAYVACGRFEAFYEYSLNPWDVAAGILLVQEAGGQVSDFKNGFNYLSGKEIIASNKNVHPAIESRIQQYF